MIQIEDDPPPSYETVLPGPSYEEEDPPPSYDEAMRSANEILPDTAVWKKEKIQNGCQEIK